MLPLSVILELRTGAEFCHERHSNISVLFSHVVDFDSITSSLSPNEVITLLNQIFSKFDQLTDEYGVYKVETIGDVYLVCAGLPQPRTDHANALAHVAVSMMESLPDFQSEERIAILDPVQLKIGIHSGPVIAGVVGMKYPRFRLMGDTVNTASRMSSTCHAGDIQLTPSAFHQLHPEEFIVQYRGLIDVKGKGRLKTYLVKGRVAKIDALCELKSGGTTRGGGNKEGMAHIVSSPAVHVEGTGVASYIAQPRTPNQGANGVKLLQPAATTHVAGIESGTPIAVVSDGSTPHAAHNNNNNVASSKQFSAGQVAKWTDGRGDSPVVGLPAAHNQQQHLGGSVRVTDDAAASGAAPISSSGVTVMETPTESIPRDWGIAAAAASAASSDAPAGAASSMPAPSPQAAVRER